MALETGQAANDNYSPEELDRARLFQEQRKHQLIGFGMTVDRARNWIRDRRAELNSSETPRSRRARIEECHAALAGLENAVRETDEAIEAAERERPSLEAFQLAQTFTNRMRALFDQTQVVIES